VAGSRRGHRLRVASGGDLRPTSEKVREAVFDALGALAGASVLDLFAGTGAMGLEALSRGAGWCVFVEGDRSIAGVLRQNIRALDYEGVSTVMMTGYETALATLIEQGRQFDLLFVDPPYRMLHQVEVMLAPRLATLLSPDGLVVVEGHRTSRTTLGGVLLFERVYGGTRVTMKRNEED